MLLTMRRYFIFSTRRGFSNKNMTWINRHVKDPYVKSATTDNLRSRSAYKLIEINDKYKILSKTNNNNNHNGDMFVIDLGSSPGGWSLVASRYVDISKGGLLLSIDLLPMEHIPGVHFIQGDFNSISIHEQIDKLRGYHRLADVILSDMLMNTCGDSITDHYRSMNICNDVLTYSDKYLDKNGHILCKFYAGSDDKELLHEAKTKFINVKFVKPKSSRKESKEMYLLAMNKR